LKNFKMKNNGKKMSHSYLPHAWQVFISWFNRDYLFTEMSAYNKRFTCGEIAAPSRHLEKRNSINKVKFCESLFSRKFYRFEKLFYLYRVFWYHG